MYPIHSAHHPSRRSRELAERLQATILEYQAREAKLTAAEVEAALASLRPARSGETRKAIGIIAGITAAFIGVGVAVSARTAGAASPALYPLIAIIALAAVLGVMLLRRSD